MGKPTGFLEHERVNESSVPVDDRLKNYNEFVITHSDDEASRQGVRCMDCGIPFHAGIVGEGPLYAELERNIEALGLSAHVTLTGKLEYAQVEALYAQANLFLFTGLVSASGDRDGFPNVIGEAMAHSVPVFTTDVSGTTEGVPHGIRGTVIDSENPEQTAAQILAVIEDTVDLERLTRAAYDWVLSDFQVGRNVQKLREALWG